MRNLQSTPSLRGRSERLAVLGLREQPGSGARKRTGRTEVLVIGNRVYLESEHSNKIPCNGPGDYGKDSNGVWWCCPPTGRCPIGNLKDHTITEHEDGTITVTPSILFSNTHAGRGYHGYLTRGEWSESA